MGSYSNEERGKDTRILRTYLVIQGAGLLGSLASVSTFLSGLYFNHDAVAVGGGVATPICMGVAKGFDLLYQRKLKAVTEKTRQHDKAIKQSPMPIRHSATYVDSTPAPFYLYKVDQGKSCIVMDEYGNGLRLFYGLDNGQESFNHDRIEARFRVPKNGDTLPFDVVPRKVTEGEILPQKAYAEILTLIHAIGDSPSVEHARRQLDGIDYTVLEGGLSILFQHEFFSNEPYASTVRWVEERTNKK